MQIIFKRQDNEIEKIEQEVSPDLKLVEVLQAVKTLLGFENKQCQFILERTGEKLESSVTFKEAGIRNNDKLILSPLTENKKIVQSPELTPASIPTPSLQPKVTSVYTPTSLDLRTAIIIGGVIGIFILIGLFLSNSQNQQTNQVLEKTPTPTPTTTPPVSESSKSFSQTIPFQPSPDSSISQEKAIQLVQAYLDAKKVIFAPPYDRQTLAGIATKKFYEKTIGGINWLQEGGSYYSYNTQRIESVEEFASQDNKATIKVRIKEDYTLYNSDGSIDKSSSNFKTLTVIYNMILIDGKLKISDSKVI